MVNTLLGRTPEVDATDDMAFEMLNLGHGVSYADRYGESYWSNFKVSRIPPFAICELTFPQK